MGGRICTSAAATALPMTSEAATTQPFRSVLSVAAASRERGRHETESDDLCEENRGECPGSDPAVHRFEDQEAANEVTRKEGRIDEPCGNSSPLIPSGELQHANEKANSKDDE